MDTSHNAADAGTAEAGATSCSCGFGPTSACGICAEAIAESECPDSGTSNYFVACDSSLQPGDLCEWDDDRSSGSSSGSSAGAAVPPGTTGTSGTGSTSGSSTRRRAAECSFNGEINNCYNGYDMYRVIECPHDGNQPSDAQ